MAVYNPLDHNMWSLSEGGSSAGHVSIPLGTDNWPWSAGRVSPEHLVERIRPHLLSASLGTTTGKQFTATLFAEQLRLLNAQIRACDKRIAELLDAHPDAAIFRSFPGIGPITPLRPRQAPERQARLATL